jgi:hypothetical protein
MKKRLLFDTRVPETDSLSSEVARQRRDQTELSSPEIVLLEFS